MQNENQMIDASVREEIIQNYVDGYNRFSVDKMVRDFDGQIQFENWAQGVVTLSLTGLAAFREQAERAKKYFGERQQKIKSFQHQADKTEIEVDYKAVLAMDLPNGLKKGTALTLTGRSVFEFRGNKIIKLTDIS